MTGKLASLRPLLYAGLFMLAGMTFLVWLGRDQSRLIGQQLGDTDLRPLINASEPLSDPPWRDHIVVMHFWGTWCGPCVEEYPQFAKLRKRFERDPRVKFISVSCSTGPELDLDDLRARTQQFLAKVDPTAEIYCDPSAYTRVQLARMLASQGLGYPTTLIIDRSGIIQDAWVGQADMQYIEKKIRLLIQ